MNLKLNQSQNEQISEEYFRFRPGDTVRVHAKNCWGVLENVNPIVWKA